MKPASTEKTRLSASVLSGGDRAAETPGVETDAGPESQRAEAIPLLQPLRVGKPTGHAASRLGGRAAGVHLQGERKTTDVGNFDGEDLSDADVSVGVKTI